MRRFFEPVDIKTVAALEKASHRWKLNQWAFRGHKDEKRGLSTTFHLACDRHGIDYTSAPDVEKQILREFARKAHLYVRDGSELPHPSDTLEWLSLMRHYGAPTRLLDWTYSIFVAAYFALDSSDRDSPSCIWAVELTWLNEMANAKAPGLNKGKSPDAVKTGAHFRQYLIPEPLRDPDSVCVDGKSVPTQPTPSYSARRLPVP